MKADEIVEVVAEALIDASFGQELPEAPRDLARAALAAAWPLIARQVLEEAADDCPLDKLASATFTASDGFTSVAVNTNKGARADVQAWLRTRAAALAPEGRGGEGT